MPFNRINGFYVGNFAIQEIKTMTLEEKNDEVNKVLEARFTQLNAALEAHEAKLKAMMVPKDTWILYASETDEDERSGQVHGEYQFFIGMVKLRGTWRLCHGNCYQSCTGPDEDFNWKPITEASIEDRLKASEHINELREAIVEEKEKLIPEVEKAIATLAKSLERYSGSDG
jgi:hypothetical protein